MTQLRQSKFNVIFLLVITSVLIAGCATTPRHVVTDWKVIDSGPKPELTTAQSLSEEAIKDLLKDPGSAQFSDWRPLYKDLKSWYGEPMVGIWKLCFDVNSKNSFGGYVGNQTFIVRMRDNKVIDVMRPRKTNYEVYKLTPISNAGRSMAQIDAEYNQKRGSACDEKSSDITRH